MLYVRIACGDGAHTPTFRQPGLALLALTHLENAGKSQPIYVSGKRGKSKPHYAGWNLRTGKELPYHDSRRPGRHRPGLRAKARKWGAYELLELRLATIMNFAESCGAANAEVAVARLILLKKQVQAGR